MDPKDKSSVENSKPETVKILAKEAKWYNFKKDGDLFEKSAMVEFKLKSGGAFYGYVYRNIKDKELSFSTVRGQTLFLENIGSVGAVKTAK